MESGPKWIQDESDLQQQSLKEQLDNLETGWNDVHILWENRKKMLIQALNHQVKKQQTDKHKRQTAKQISSLRVSGIGIDSM